MADYRLEVMVHSYSNLDGNCAAYDGYCCDINITNLEEFCSNELPDPYFIFCLKPAGETDSNSSSCSLGRKVSPTTNSGQEVVSLTFTSGNHALFGLSNPLSFDVSGNWLV